MAAPKPPPLEGVRGGGVPWLGGLLLGLGMGGFVDGIVFHQILQWHHMLSSAGQPPDSLLNLQTNVLADGLFHGATWLLTLAGIAAVWRAARSEHPPWPALALPGAMLLGFGLFNLIEGIVNHLWLGIHHVNERVPREHWLVWDMAFLGSGLLLSLVGALVLWRYARPVR
ncbi:MAG: DUF2243 domain-containing protein [Pseudomonadota bacterium]